MRPQAFGGVPQELLFDQMKAVIMRRHTDLWQTLHAAQDPEPATRRRRSRQVATSRGTSAMQIDVIAPPFGTQGATSVNSSTAQVGEVLTYTVAMDNKTGDTDANNVVLTVPLPAGMSFVAGSFRLDGTAHAQGADPDERPTRERHQRSERLDRAAHCAGHSCR